MKYSDHVNVNIFMSICQHHSMLLCWCHSVNVTLLMKRYVVEQHLLCTRWLRHLKIWHNNLALIVRVIQWFLKTCHIRTAGSAYNSRNFRDICARVHFIHFNYWEFLNFINIFLTFKKCFFQEYTVFFLVMYRMLFSCVNPNT